MDSRYLRLQGSVYQAVARQTGLVCKEWGDYLRLEG